MYNSKVTMFKSGSISVTAEQFENIKENFDCFVKNGDSRELVIEVDDSNRKELKKIVNQFILDEKVPLLIMFHY